jgi:phosphotransferase system enzyme I (PtsI)/phosphotransferase system enzyme I (PtsP)
MSNGPLFTLTRILQDSGLASNSQDQVRMIVDGISEVIGVDVCSLYRNNGQQGLALLASHGLFDGYPVVIPCGKGLVGQVIKNRCVVNLIDPQSQPEYYYVAQSHEEHFKSFCGVPLIHRGEVIGVLVVQRRRAEVLSPEQEALLLTLSIHLAILVDSWPEDLACNPSDPNLTNQRKKGISGAPGLAIGEVVLQREASLDGVQESACQDVAAEQLSWLKLQEAAAHELTQERKIVESTLGETMAAVLDAYLLLLADPGFCAHIEAEITKGKTLPWAIKVAVNFFSEQFLAMEDPYLRARHEDIQHLGEKLFQVWRDQHHDGLALKQGVTDLRSLNGGESASLILVGKHISVSDIVSLPSKTIKAIVCSGGAALSHIAIFANALGVPAVMGLGELTVQEGEQLIVNGDDAHVIVHPSEVLLEEYQKLIQERRALDQNLLDFAQLPALSLDGERVAILANSGLQADIMPGLRNGAEGVGLYRTEIPFMIRQSLPTEDDQVQVYQQLLNAYLDKPVYFRTLDIGGDKPLPYLPSNHEDNPALGLRGVRFSLDNPALLLTQLRAMIRASGLRNDVHILLPMIASTEELDACIALLDEAVLQLKAEGLRVQRPLIGIMVEVPAVTAMLPFWRDKIDFVSIGTNDLSQYLLAVDRNNPRVAKFYDSLHPAVLREIQGIVELAKDYDLPLCVCGEMASDPVALMMLIGMGVRRFSMSTSKIPYSKWLIRSLTVSDTEALFDTALTLDCASKIRRQGLQFLESIGNQHDQ